MEISLEPDRSFSVNTTAVFMSTAVVYQHNLNSKMCISCNSVNSLIIPYDLGSPASTEDLRLSVTWRLHRTLALPHPPSLLPRNRKQQFAS